MIYVPDSWDISTKIARIASSKLVTVSFTSPTGEEEVLKLSHGLQTTTGSKGIGFVC